MTVAAIAALGLIIGSFLNVVVARLPERRSLWAPRSACPSCGAAIAWHDNIPVLSFVALYVSQSLLSRFVPKTSAPSSAGSPATSAPAPAQEAEKNPAAA